MVDIVAIVVVVVVVALARGSTAILKRSQIDHDAGVKLSLMVQGWLVCLAVEWQMPPDVCRFLHQESNSGTQLCAAWIALTFVA